MLWRVGVRSHRWVVGLTAVAASIAGAAHAAATERVLVWQVVPVGVDDDALATWARTDLELQVRRVAGFETIKREPVREIVSGEYPDLADCLAEVACLCEIGAIAEADVVLVATLAQLGEHWSVTLRAVRVAKRTATVAVSESLSGDEAAISARMAEILPQALAPPVETLPVVATSDTPTARGWWWAKWGTAGGAALAGAGALTAGLLTLRTHGQQTELCPRGRCPTTAALADARALKRDGEQLRTWTNISLIATAVLSAAAATLFLLDDSSGGAR